MKLGRKEAEPNSTLGQVGATPLTSGLNLPLSLQLPKHHLWERWDVYRDTIQPCTASSISSLLKAPLFAPPYVPQAGMRDAVPSFPYKVALGVMGITCVNSLEMWG